MMALDLRVRKDPVNDQNSPGISPPSPPKSSKVTLNIPQPSVIHPVLTSNEHLPPVSVAVTSVELPPASAVSIMAGLPRLPCYSIATSDFTRPKLVDNMTRSGSLSPDDSRSAVQRELNKLRDDWSKCRLENARITTPRTRKFDGSRGVGWTTIGDVIVPYIMRGPSKYVSVRVVETKLLSSLQGVNLDKMSHAGPLYSYYITEQEARLFTEINSRCYNHQFGLKPFTTQDLIVSLAEFERFYDNLRKQCGIPPLRESRVTAIMETDSSSITTPPLIQNINDTSVEGVDGGWVQINNTVVPYVFRNGVKFVPLTVIKYAAGLLTDVRIDGYKTPCTEMEYKYINNACKQVGVDFGFMRSTNFIKLELVIRMSNCRVTIKELPTDNPFSHATFQHHVHDQIIVFPTSSSPELAANQNPSLFQIPCPSSISSAADSFTSMFTPVTAIASHALQFFNASAMPNLNVDMKGNVLASHANGHGVSNLSPKAHLPLQNSGQVLENPTKKLATFSKVKAPRLVVSKPPALAKPPKIPSFNIGQPNKIVIECVEYENKTLPCLHREGLAENAFVLVESVMRLYFPHTTLDQFLDVLQGVMDVSIVHLKSVEEQAFIRFYNLPVKAMRYKFMMMFCELRRCFADLKSYFSVGVLQKSLHSKHVPMRLVNMDAAPAHNLNSTSNILSSQSPDKVTPNSEITTSGPQLKDCNVETGESPVCFVVDNNMDYKKNQTLPLISPKPIEAGESVERTDHKNSNSSEESDIEEERKALLYGYSTTDENVASKAEKNIDESPLLCKGAMDLKEASKSSNDNSNDEGEESRLVIDTSYDDEPPTLSMAELGHSPKLMIDDLSEIGDEPPNLMESETNSVDSLVVSARKEDGIESKVECDKKSNVDVGDDGSMDSNVEEGISANDLKVDETEQNDDSINEESDDIDPARLDRDKNSMAAMGEKIAENNQQNGDGSGDKYEKNSVETIEYSQVSPLSRKRSVDSEENGSPPVKEKKLKVSGSLFNKLESALAKLKQRQKEKLNAGEESNDP